MRRSSALVLISAAVLQAGPAAGAPEWRGIKHEARELADPLARRHLWETRDVHYFRSAASPGILLRMRSSRIRFFSGLDRYGAEPPSVFWIKTATGTKAVARGQSVRGSEMAASWIVASFQGSSGWSQFDAPWFLSLEKRPALIALSPQGLEIGFQARDTGYVFSMPLYGYAKLPQKENDFAARHKLPSLGLEPWKWAAGLPESVTKRCDWWAGVAKAYPVGFQESFSVNPATDEITFRQDYRWLTVTDDWGTKPIRFASLPPAVGLAWKFPGFPMRTSAEIYDPDYFTAYGPFVGAVETSRIEYSMKVLQYIHEMEVLAAPQTPSGPQAQALDLIDGGLRDKFPTSWRYLYDHGSRENFCWNVVGDVWYPRALQFAAGALKRNAEESLRIYMENDVLRPHSPFHGKYILHGPGIGSWGERGDAGKFMTDALQAVWAYAEFTGDWQLIRDRWPLVKKFFNTPDEADWLSYGRYAIAEIGDEAAPCSAYARMAWKAGDIDEYLLGAYMFSRELVHPYIKQRAAPYFYRHQPYNQYRPMPPMIYPTDVWGSTRGWQVDGPLWGHLSSGEHQSANRWIRFHDPDVGRFYRDHLAAGVQEELAWYAKAGAESRADVYDVKRYREFLTRDNPHTMPSLLRLRSLLVGASVDTSGFKPAVPARSRWGAADIAAGYALLRAYSAPRFKRLVPKSLPASPFVTGLERNTEESGVTAVQDVRETGIRIEPRWHGWDMPRNPGGTPEGAHRSFGSIEGDFNGRIAGEEGHEWIAYGCRVDWAGAIAPRTLRNPEEIVRAQDQTPVAVIGPFGNMNDDELFEAVYPPEKEIDLNASYPGAFGLVSWRTTRLTAGRRLDLTKELAGPAGTGTLAYAVQFVWSPEEMQAYLLVRHQGGVVAWINDSQVFRFHGPHRPSKEESHLGLARLHKGWNKILLKLESFTGDYTFGFRLSHLDRQPVAGLKFAHRPEPAAMQVSLLPGSGRRRLPVAGGSVVKPYNPISQ